MFFFPSGFFVALAQIYAKNNLTPLDQITFEHEICTEPAKAEKLDPDEPINQVIIDGIFLEGATIN